MRFSLGVNYWPRSTATAMWERLDPGEIGADFAHIAGLGLDAVRVFLRWDQFAPAPDRIDARMLERLETVVGLAHENGLAVMPVLLCGHMSGVNFAPDWALDRSGPRGPYRTFTGGRESPHPIANIYAGPLLDAQVRLARAVGERLREHPALRAWDIAHAFTNVRSPSPAKVTSGEHSQAPADEAAVAEWSRRLTDALREFGAVPVTAGTHAGDLTQDRNLRLGSLCAPFAFASMQVSSVRAAVARSRLDPELVPFFASLTAGFAHKPVIISGLGQPTCPPGKFSAAERFALPGEPPNLHVDADDPVFAPFPCLSEDENAYVCASVLERLHADGRLGAYWWCWADYADDVRALPPFDEAPEEAACGIVRSDGGEKPIAAALKAFALQRREVMTPNDMPAIASAYYYRTLPTSTATLYEAFQRFVSERRTPARS
jgi:hypothetical protein